MKDNQIKPNYSAQVQTKINPLGGEVVPHTKCRTNHKNKLLGNYCGGGGAYPSLSEWLSERQLQPVGGVVLPRSLLGTISQDQFRWTWTFLYSCIKAKDEM